MAGPGCSMNCRAHIVYGTEYSEWDRRRVYVWTGLPIRQFIEQLGQRTQPLDKQNKSNNSTKDCFDCAYSALALNDRSNSNRAESLSIGDLGYDH